jgi:hypothetical protein
MMNKPSAYDTIPKPDRPETKYVMSGETSIAYQVFGQGDQDQNDQIAASSFRSASFRSRPPA